MSVRTPRSIETGGAPARTGGAGAAAASAVARGAVTPITAPAPTSATGRRSMSSGREGSRGEGSREHPGAAFVRADARVPSRRRRRYTPESNGYLPRASEPGESGDRRDLVADCSRPARSAEPPLFVDVREQDEWQEGHLPGAVHVPRGNLESRIEALVPDKSTRDRRVLRGRLALRVRCEVACRARLRQRRFDGRRLSDWKRNGYEFTDAESAHL